VVTMASFIGRGVYRWWEPERWEASFACLWNP
jgi:hypothetical protein